MDSRAKADREDALFRDFAIRSSLPIELRTIQKRHPPEPDILCNVGDSGYIAFELAEICDETTAQTCSYLLKTGDQTPQFTRQGDPVREILKKKLSKQYRTGYPVELILYTDGFISLPPNVLIPEIQSWYDAFDLPNPSPFQKIWFMGMRNETCECII